MSDNYQATFGAPLTRAELVADNPYVPQFEFLQESDAPYGIKVGPGYWNDRPYLANSGVKVYDARLTQTGTNAPTATVLENTLGGTLVWTRNLAGSYIGTLAGAFTVNKTTLTPNGFLYVNSSALPADDDILAGAELDSVDTVRVKTVLGADSSGQDGWLTNWPIRILVYP